MAKKKDEGHEETEKVLADLEKRITKEYAQAEKELTEKLNDYLKRFEKKDEIKRKAMEEGKISEEDYAQWRLGQIAIGERWKDMRDTMAKDMANASQMAKDITNAAMPEVYAINHNYGTFQVEKAAKMDTSYTMYDKNTAKRLFDDSNTFYKGPGKKLTKAINEGKQVAWDKKQIQSIMTQALLQGKPIGAIATDLCNKVGDSDRKAAIRNARTMTTGIQNAGRIDSYKRAEDMGIDLMQEWMATLDDRTRHEHRVLDGQRVKVGDKFKVEGYEIEYPGDPSAEPEMVYNCRCTLVPVLKGFEVDSTDLTLRNDNHMKEETYEEWKESHDIVSHSITKQDELAEMFKESYIQDYKYLAGQNPYIPSDSDNVTLDEPKKKDEDISNLINEQQNLLNKYGSATNLMLFGSEEDIVRWQELQNLTSMNEKALLDIYASNANNWENILDNQTKKQMEKFTEQLLDVATDRELSAINLWTSETYANINRYMRYGHNVDDISKDAAINIKNCLNRIRTTEDIVVRRGTGIKEMLDGVQGDWRNDLDLLTGYIYKDGGFVATSPLKEGGFSGSGYNNAELFIHVPKGTHGAYIEKEAHNEEEKEFLLQSGYNYKIIKAEYRPNPYFPDEKDLKLWVEVIPND